MYLGDFKEDGDVFFKFTTRAFATGIPTVLANTPVLSVFIDENTTGKTTAESYFDLDVSLGSIVGYNNVRIDLSGDAFFATGGDYSVVITTGTVDSVSVVGEVVATFSIENRSMGQPVGATLADDIAAIKAETVLILADTDDIGVAGAGLTDLGGMSDGMKAEVESEANDALVAQKLDHLVAAADGDDPVNGSIMAHLVSATEDWSTFVPSTDSLQAVRDHATTIKTETAAILDDTDLIDDGTSGLAKIATDVAAVLVDTGTSGVIVATNNDKQGYNAHVDTTINGVPASQTEFILTAGPGDDDALNNMIAVFEDADGDKSQGIRISGYAGGTKTVTLSEAPTFTIVDTDIVRVYTAVQIDDAAIIAAAIADLATAGHVTAGTFGAQWKTVIDRLDAGMPRDLMVSTTIATLASQTSFTLTAGSADDDAYNGARAVVTDITTGTQKAVGLVDDYAGGTLTVTLSADPGIFTMAVGDNIDIMAAPVQLNEVTAARMAVLTDWVDGGRLDLLLDAIPTTAMRGTDDAALAAVATEARLSELDAGTVGKAANQIDEIRTDTGEIGAAGAGLTNINLPNQTMDIIGNITGNLSGSVGSVTGHTNQTGDNFAIVNGAAGLVAIDTVVDALKVVIDKFDAAQSEPGQGAPAANETPLVKIAYLFKQWRNESDNDGSIIQLYNDGASTVDQKRTVSETAGTVTKAEVATGP